MAEKVQLGNINGRSAYQIAVEEGFSGTEAEWLESLKGDVTPAAVEARDAAVAAAGAASGAASAAESAAARAEAVPVTNDGIMAPILADPDSASGAQLRNTIAQQVDAGGGARPAFPTDDWFHVGDSMTAGGWPAYLASKTGKNHYNAGIGGQTSAQIASRTSALYPTFAAFTIPASGSVAVAPTPNPVREGSQYNRTGYVAGVECVLSQTGASSWTLTRTVPGLPVPVAAGEPFITIEGAAYRDRTATIWVGRNNFTQTGAAAAIVAHIQAIIDRLTPMFKRILVMEIPPWVSETTGTGTRTTLNAVNAAIKAAFPQYYVENMTWLRSDAARAVAGITWTSTDLANIAAGVTPASFRADDGHLNTLGNQVMAEYVWQEAIARGWAEATYPDAPVPLAALYLPESFNAALNRWDDMTGNGRHLEKIDTRAVPVPADVDGVEALRFDGNAIVRGGISPAFTAAQPFTAYVLARVTGYPASGRSVIASVNNNVNAFIPSIGVSGTAAIRIGTTDRTLGTTIDDSWHLFGAVVNGASSLAVLDATETPQTFDTTTGINRLSLGANNADASVPAFVGDIAAVAIATSALDSTGRAALVDFLLDQTGIVL